MKKTIKLITSRLRITRNKKIMHRTVQQGHKKAKETGNIMRSKRKLRRAESSLMKKVARKYHGTMSNS